MSVLDLLVGSVVDYAIFALDAEGNVATWNPGAERLKGYTADEIIGRHFSAFYTQPDLDRRLPWTGLATATETGRFEDEGWRLRKDGTQFWANVVITALRDGQGELIGFGKVTRDLTERKAAEDAVRDSEEQIRGVDRMRRELVARIAHDLRGPVSVVVNLLDLLLEGWDDLDDDSRRERVARARLRAETLAGLTDDVFDISLIDAGTLEVVAEPFDVRAIAADVVDDANAAALGQQVAVIGGHPVAMACGDPRRTWQILTNLVSNAVKFAVGDEPVEVAVTEALDEVRVAVHNAGPAIPLEAQERIFDRFVRLEGVQRAPGSGLGLFIARSLAEAQGGAVTVSSTEEAGTTFTLVLPARAPAAP